MQVSNVRQKKNAGFKMLVTVASFADAQALDGISQFLPGEFVDDNKYKVCADRWSA